MIKNPFAIKKEKFEELPKSKGILDDYAVRKDVQTRTITAAYLTLSTLISPSGLKIANAQSATNYLLVGERRADSDVGDSMFIWNLGKPLILGSELQTSPIYMKAPSFLPLKQSFFDPIPSLGSAAYSWLNAYIGTMTISAGSITDTSGAISFGNENLTTTGTLAAGVTTVGSTIQRSLIKLHGTDGTITTGVHVADATAGLGLWQNASSIEGCTSDVNGVLTANGTLWLNYYSSGNIDWGVNGLGGSLLNAGGIFTTGTLEAGAGTLASLSLTTDLTVANGGTGRSTNTAYALHAGGTNTTAAHTSIANSATTGVILRGAGTSAYPAWTTATYPATTTDNCFLVSSSNNVISGTDTSLTWDGTTLLAALGTLSMMSFKLGGSTNGVTFSNSNGVLMMQGSKTMGNNEALSIDFENVANTIGFAAGGGTGVTAITFSSLNLTTTGIITINSDSNYLVLGAGQDASIKYDGTNLVINPKVVGTGIVDVTGTLQTDGYNAADGSAGATGNFTSADGKTITVKNGLITSIV